MTEPMAPLAEDRPVDNAPGEHVKAKKAHLNLATIAIAGLLAVIVAMTVSMVMDRTQTAQTAQQQAMSLADEITAECADGKIEVGGRDLCQKAEQTRQDVEQAMGPRGFPGEPGAPGRPGRDGEDGQDGRDGRDGSDGADAPAPAPGQDGAPGADGADGVDGQDGADSSVPGPTGPPGKDGANGADGKDSTVPGPRGATGATGARGPAGPAGKDSTVPGPAGPSGPPGPVGSPGPNGVGIQNMDCRGSGASSYWHITLTNGEPLIGAGPCKATAAEPQPQTTPTE